MEELLIFYGRWHIISELLERRPGLTAMRLTISGAGAADGQFLNPAPGWGVSPAADEWTLRLDVSLDARAFEWRPLKREFGFDAATGLVADVRSSLPPDLVFFGDLRLKCMSGDVRSHPMTMPDFTIPERGHHPPP